jgi:hypothetical protein
MDTFNRSTKPVRNLTIVIAALAIAFALFQRTDAQTPQTSPPAQAGQRGPGGGGGGRGGGGMRGAEPVAYDDYTGFTKLWDGQTLNNWDGETDVWSIDNGALHADTTKTPGQHHIIYKGPGALMKDFDFKVEFRISETGANGGIQYRSRLLHPAHGGSIADPMGKALPANITTLAAAIAAGVTSPPANPPAGGRGGGGAPNPWQVSGYQYDLDSNNSYTGGLYEGQGRGIVNLPGGIAYLLPDRKNVRIGSVADKPAEFIKPHKGLAGEWNQVEIIARGNTLIHIANGHVTSVTVDENSVDRAMQGILSLQLEGSGQIWYRNVYVKPLN